MQPGPTDDLFAGMPTSDPLGGGFESGYSSPAPMAPQPARRRPAKRRSGRNPTGPILSIVSGSLGTIFAIVLVIYSISSAVDFISRISAVLERDATPRAMLVIIAILTVLISLTLLGLIGSCIYSLVLGILELSQDYRKSIASKLTGGLGGLYAILSLAILIVFVIQFNQIGSFNIHFNGRSYSNTSVITGFVLRFFLLLIVPAFLIFVGIFRWNDDS